MSDAECESLEQELQKALAALQRDLGWIDFMQRPGRPDGAMEYLVMRVDHTALRIDASHNHGRPHFHIDFKNQFSASYAIETFECLAGHMPKKYSARMLEWAKEHQPLLYEKWKVLHPNSPVFAIECKGDPVDA